MSSFANTPTPPYYAVIFTSKKSQKDLGYSKMAKELKEILSGFDGFLGAESLRRDDGFGVTISYWDSLESIKRWKNNPKHLEAQEKGKKIWYQEYKIRIAKVKREYGFESKKREIGRKKSL